MKGRAAIREHYVNEIATAWAKTSYVIDAPVVAGDWAWRSGTWSCCEPPLSGKASGCVAPHRGGLALAQGHLESGRPRGARASVVRVTLAMVITLDMVERRLAHSREQVDTAGRGA